MVYDWDSQKEELLNKSRNLSFLHVIYHIERGDLLDVRKHPNKVKYSHQKLLIVKMNNYVYIVPIIEDGETWFLKTIIPSRKETKKYLK